MSPNYFTLHSGQTIGGWSTDGIMLDSSPGLPVLCNTTHLTSFAVLVSAGGSEVLYILYYTSMLKKLSKDCNKK